MAATSTLMVLNEPQARTASISENNFILTVISAANSVTDKPISVRFIGYSPSTGHYSPEIDKVCDLSAEIPIGMQETLQRRYMDAQKQKF